MKSLVISPTPFPCMHTQFIALIIMVSQSTAEEVFIDDLPIYKALSSRVQSFDQISLHTKFSL